MVRTTVAPANTPVNSACARIASGFEMAAYPSGSGPAAIMVTIAIAISAHNAANQRDGKAAQSEAAAIARSAKVKGIKSCVPISSANAMAAPDADAMADASRRRIAAAEKIARVPAAVHAGIAWRVMIASHVSGPRMTADVIAFTIAPSLFPAWVARHSHTPAYSIP